MENNQQYFFGKQFELDPTLQVLEFHNNKRR
jgi:hypothetical protein